MKNPHPDFPLVYVEWHDAYANSTWMSVDQYERWKTPHCMMTHEIGWLIEKHKDYVVIASRFNPFEGNFGQWQMIPRTWCKITVLAKPNRS